MDNPKYDNMAVTPNNDNITITLDETTRPKRLRKNDTPDEVKTKTKGQKVSHKDQSLQPIRPMSNPTVK
jgi:hypothetical protein